LNLGMRVLPNYHRFHGRRFARATYLDYNQT
jgi:hypothetical protein